MSPDFDMVLDLLRTRGLAPEGTYGPIYSGAPEDEVITETNDKRVVSYSVKSKSPILLNRFQPST